MTDYKRYGYIYLEIVLLWITGIAMSMFLAGDLRYDAADYWVRGFNLWKEGSFSLLNIDGARGYIFPFFCGVCDRLWGINGFRIINSLLLSLWWVLVVPRLHEQNMEDCQKRRNFISVAICFLLFNLFFYGLSIYPLSDLFAIALCSMGIVCLLEIEHGCEWKKSIFLSFLLGCLVYLAYNVRTIYLFAGIYLVFRLFVFAFKASQQLWKKIGWIMGSACGIVAAALPQLYMNYKQLGIFSFKVPTSGLMLQQVYWGIQYQRYDTYTGLAERTPSMYFMDPVGNALLSQGGIEEFANWGDFFLFILRHPCEVIGIYVRHIVNVLLPCWPNQYVTDVSSNKVMLGLLCYICIFLFGVAVSSRMIKGKVINNYIALLVPVVFILPGAVEVRFVAALYIMLFGTLCYNVAWSSMKAYFVTHKMKLAIEFCILGGLLLAIWTSMLASEGVSALFMS